MAQAPEFKYAPMFQVGEDTTEYYHSPPNMSLSVILKAKKS